MQGSVEFFNFFDESRAALTVNSRHDVCAPRYSHDGRGKAGKRVRKLNTHRCYWYSQEYAASNMIPSTYPKATAALPLACRTHGAS
jgi:hypothetical protein